jgi:hypothetical protein
VLKSVAFDDLPLPVVNLLNAIGVPWPYLNEDTISEFAGLVREFRSAVAATHEEASEAVAAITRAHQSVSTEVMQSGWTSLAARHVSELAGPVQHRRCHQRSPQRTQTVNQQSHATATLSRLLTVDWDGDFDVSYRHAVSRAKLMREYLRRSARWADRLNATSEWPFFDIAGRLAPEIEPPAELARQLEDAIVERTGWPSHRTVARAALRWAALLDAGTPFPPDLGDPFEPLLLMFDRGGAYTTEAGFIDLGASSVPRRTWYDNLSTDPVTALDPATLDALDQTAAD